MVLTAYCRRCMNALLFLSLRLASCCLPLLCVELIRCLNVALDRNTEVLLCQISDTFLYSCEFRSLNWVIILKSECVFPICAFHLLPVISDFFQVFRYRGFQIQHGFGEILLTRAVHIEPTAWSNDAKMMFQLIGCFPFH